MTISQNDLEVLVQLYEQSTWEELELQCGNLSLYLGRGEPGRKRLGGNALAGPVSAKQLASPPVDVVAKPALPVAPASQTVTKSKVAGSELPEGCVAVLAPSLGSFYRAAKPGAAPYVEVGQRVEEQTDMCLIEVMKLFTTVQAGVAGVVQEVFAKDGEMVEFGQPLFVINTRG